MLKWTDLWWSFQFSKLVSQKTTCELTILSQQARQNRKNQKESDKNFKYFKNYSS